MIDNLPAYVGWLFAATVLLTCSLYLFAVRLAGRGQLPPVLTAVVFVALLVTHAVLAHEGFYLAKTVPPRFPLAPLPTTIILITLFFALARRDVPDESLRMLTLLSTVRVPVEVVLLWLYRHGQVPQLMTFEGRNFDVLSGLSAPVVAWLAFRGGKVNRPLLIVWNLLALCLLINIVAHAILSLESPFQRFAFEQPNRGVLYFPFIWLPAVIVPIVLVSHIVSLRELLRRKH